MWSCRDFQQTSVPSMQLKMGEAHVTPFPGDTSLRPRGWLLCHSSWEPLLGLPSPGGQLSAMSMGLQGHVARWQGVGRVGEPGRTQCLRERSHRSSKEELSWDQVSCGHLAGAGHLGRVWMLWLLGWLSKNISPSPL